MIGFPRFASLSVTVFYRHTLIALLIDSELFLYTIQCLSSQQSNLYINQTLHSLQTKISILPPSLCDPISRIIHCIRSKRGLFALVKMDFNSPILPICQNEQIRRRLFSHLSKDDLAALRQTSCAFANLITKVLFASIRSTFSPTSLTRQCRLEALGRIGHHVKHFTFCMHHSEATFLPPLLNPRTGQEINFLYTPHTSLASETERPKYGTSELGDYLTQQYPAIFHAATNVPTFIRALSCMQNLVHISISCPDQVAVERYRRSAVDYALISLRIAIERAELPHLSKFSLAVHPGALLYLHATPNFGASPSALRRWRQIKNLKLSIDSWSFDNAPTDHLKLLTNYLRVFSSTIEKLTFHWYGARGPCPLTTAFRSSRPSSPSPSTSSNPTATSQKLFAEITSPMSPLPLTPGPGPLQFGRLRRVQARNTYVTAHQVSTFISFHGSTLKSLDFDNVVLTSGTWDDALAPLGRMSSKEAVWEARHSGNFTGPGTAIDPSASSLTTPVDEEDDPFRREPKATTSAATRELRESFIEQHIAETPSHVNIHKRHRRRRRRRTSSPPPPPSLKHQASSLLGKLKKEASQSSFFGMFRHVNESGRSRQEIGVVDEHVFLMAPAHKREMPTLEIALESVPELDFPTPAHGTFLKSATYNPARGRGLVTPPRTPLRKNMSTVEDADATPRSQIWEFDRPRSDISYAPLLPATTYSPTYTSPIRHNGDTHPALRQQIAITPPESPSPLLPSTRHVPSTGTPQSEVERLLRLSPTMYQSVPAHPAEQSPCPGIHEKRIYGQPLSHIFCPPLTRCPPHSPSVYSTTTHGGMVGRRGETPCTRWPSIMPTTPPNMGMKSPTPTPAPLNPKPHLPADVQGNQRDLAREAWYQELTLNPELREETLRSAKARLLGRLGRKYNQGNEKEEAKVGRHRRNKSAEETQKAVREEIWSGCRSGEWDRGDLERGMIERGAVVESIIGETRDRSVLVPFMVIR